MVEEKHMATRAVILGLLAGYGATVMLSERRLRFSTARI